MKDLAKFTPESVLSESSVNKTLTLLGRLSGEDGQAIVLLSRRHFPVQLDTAEALLKSAEVKETFSNDIYSKFEASVVHEHSLVNIDVIHPCTEKHISKHRAQQPTVLIETPRLYAAATLPHIDGLPPSAIQWVYNILDRSQEAERLLFEDPDPQVGFMLHPDLKWDQVQVEAMYCLAIVHRKDLRSLRDLRAEHVPLLENVLAKSRAEIERRYDVPAEKLRCYLHYPPTYYHLHIHFVHACYDASFGMAVGMGHAVEDVISALKLSSEFYQNVDLTVALGEYNPLLAKLRAAQQAHCSASTNGPE